MPRVKLVEIDCGDIRGSQFDLNPHERESLIDAGRRAAEDALQRFGHDLSKVCESRTNRLLGGANDAKAMEHGITLMTRFHQDLSKEVSNRVFISYCHEDKAWFERVKKQFEAAFPISSTWDGYSHRAGGAVGEGNRDCVEGKYGGRTSFVSKVLYVQVHHRA
jgi:hypothetical protein